MRERDLPKAANNGNERVEGQEGPYAKRDDVDRVKYGARDPKHEQDELVHVRQVAKENVKRTHDVQKPAVTSKSARAGKATEITLSRLWLPKAAIKHKTGNVPTAN